MSETLSSVRVSSAEKLDLVLAYVLGDISEPERIEFEDRLSAGDTELALAYEQALESFSGLPRALTSAIPPPFVKERVLARVRTEQRAESFAVELAESIAPSRCESLFARILRQIPGYGAFAIGTLSPSRTSARRTIGFAFLVLGGVFASAYAVDKVASVLRSSDSAKQSAKRTHQAAELGLPSHNLDLGNLGADDANAKSVITIESPDASVASAGEIAPSTASTKRAIDKKTASEVSSVRGPVVTELLQTNLTLFDAAIYFSSSAATLKYVLRPMDGVKGEGKLLWDRSHSDALFAVSDLSPNPVGSHYVLWYLMDDGSTKRLSNFDAMSGARISFFVSESPGQHVRGALLTLETPSRAGSPASSVTVLEASRVMSKR